MFQTKRILFLLFSVCIVSCFFCFFAAKNLFTDLETVPKNKLIVENGNALPDILGEEVKADAREEEAEVVAVSTEEKTKTSTKLIYQYYNEKNELVKQEEDFMPYFLLDLTLSEMQRYFPDWMISSFSSSEIVLRKNMEEEKQGYIVGQQDGFVAIFYEKEKNGISLYELTDTPVSSLSHAEQVRLNDGIYVKGDDKLARILEDYES